MHINNLQILKEAHHQHIKPHESQIVLQNPGLSFAKNADKICTIECQAIPKSPTSPKKYNPYTMKFIKYIHLLILVLRD